MEGRAKAEVLTQGNLEEMFQIPVELVERGGVLPLVLTELAPAMIHPMLTRRSLLASSALASSAAAFCRLGGSCRQAR
ncbi:MAG: hypothetical protein R2724_23890 [Bryobacterales bacterium]